MDTLKQVVENEKVRRARFFDIHAHLNFSAFDADRDEVAKRALDQGVFMINVGTQQDTSKSAVELAEKYEHGMYATVGLHPVHTDKSYHDEAELGVGGKAFVSRGEEFDFEYYKNLAKHPKVVAMGECGLDYFHLEDGSMEKQKNVFIKHIELANKVGKPLMLHVRSSKDRSAYKEACQILKEHAKVPFNFHFFAGSIEEAKEILELGGNLSFTGVITFAKQYEELVKFVPPDRMMSETDCPYVSPAPYRGKRNEPAYVIEVVKKIAEIKGLSFEEVSNQLVKNAINFFGLQGIS